MKESGYPEKYRENVILSALSAWEKMVKLDRAGTKQLQRELEKGRKKIRQREKDKELV